MNPISKTFCASPWIHMRVLSSGKLLYCRWLPDKNNQLTSNLYQTDFVTYFQKEMSSLRATMLQGGSLDACNQCFIMEKHGKVSGREKQLLKVGIDTKNFEKTLRSSTFYDEFAKSAQNNGDTDLWPQDWQIDLGNHCNSACIFCEPKSSSKLATEFMKLGLINKLPPRNWTDDPVAIERFIELLTKSKKLQYIHFIGGETLVTPAFNRILTQLVDKGLHKETTIGFTTNLTIWDNNIIDLLKKFKSVNVGMSVECLHPINDYLRWPSNIEHVKDMLNKWVTLSKEIGWLIQIRTTPTVFSIAHLKTIYDYAYDNQVGVESCNFLNNPDFMRMSILPKDVRESIAEDLDSWVKSKNVKSSDSNMVNVRDPNLTREYILRDALSYVDYLRNGPDETNRWPDLVNYIKKLESSRKNTILDYAPEYEHILQSAGY